MSLYGHNHDIFKAHLFQEAFPDTLLWLLSCKSMSMCIGSSCGTRNLQSQCAIQRTLFELRQQALNGKNQVTFKGPFAAWGKVLICSLPFYYYYYYKHPKVQLSTESWSPSMSGAQSLRPGHLGGSTQAASLPPVAGAQAFPYNCGLHNCEFKCPSYITWHL